MTPQLSQLPAKLFGQRRLPTVTAAVILAAMFIFGNLYYPNFETVPTLSNLFRGSAHVGIAAVGMTLVILTGGIDLSVGAAAAFTSILTAKLVTSGIHPLAALPIVLLVGSGFGAAMGGLIHRFALPAFMVTLAGMFAMRAGGFLIHDQSLAITHAFYPWSDRTLEFSVLEFVVSLRTAIFFGVLAIGMLVLARTPLGMNIYALGGNERAARAMGVPVATTRVAVYAISGLCAALAGWVYTLITRSGNPSAATGMELDVIASVVIGGTLLAGGVGSLLGTLIGVMILAMIQTLIDFRGDLSASWTSIATGILLLLCVGAQRLILRR